MVRAGRKDSDYPHHCTKFPQGMYENGGLLDFCTNPVCSATDRYPLSPVDYAGELAFWLRRVVSTETKSTGGLVLKGVSRLMLYVVMLFGGIFRAEADQPALVFPPMTGSVVDAAQMLDSQTAVRLAVAARA